MHGKFLSMTGICRKAGLLQAGHDAVKDSVRNGKAGLVFFAADASERLQKEITNLNNGITVLKTDITAEQFGLSAGKKAAVFSVTDKKFAQVLLAKYEEE